MFKLENKTKLLMKIFIYAILATFNAITLWMKYFLFQFKTILGFNLQQMCSFCNILYAFYYYFYKRHVSLYLHSCAYVGVQFTCC